MTDAALGQRPLELRPFDVNPEQVDHAVAALQQKRWTTSEGPERESDPHTGGHYDYLCAICRPDLENGFERIVAVVVQALGGTIAPDIDTRDVPLGDLEGRDMLALARTQPTLREQVAVLVDPSGTLGTPEVIYRTLPGETLRETAARLRQDALAAADQIVALLAEPRR